jgi:hypothetical protein
MNTFIKLFFKHFGLKSFMYIISVIGLLANQLPEYFYMINTVAIFMIMYQIIIIYFLYCVYRKDIEEFKLGISNNSVKELKILFSKVAYNYINVQEYVKNLKMSSYVNYVQHLVIIFKTETIMNLIKFFLKYFSIFLLKPLGFTQHPAAHGFWRLLVSGGINCNRVTRGNLPDNILNGNIILPLGLVGILGKVFSFINAGSIDILDVDIKWIVIFIIGGLFINILLDNLNNKDSTSKMGTKTKTSVPAVFGSGSGSGDSSEDDEKPKSRWERIKKFYWNHQQEIHAIAFGIVATFVFIYIPRKYPKNDSVDSNASTNNVVFERPIPVPVDEVVRVKIYEMVKQMRVSSLNVDICRARWDDKVISLNTVWRRHQITGDDLRVMRVILYNRSELANWLLYKLDTKDPIENVMKDKKILRDMQFDIQQSMLITQKFKCFPEEFITLCDCLASDCMVTLRGIDEKHFRFDDLR